MCYSFQVCTASYTVTDKKMIIHGSFFCLPQMVSQIYLHLAFALSFSVTYKTQDGREQKCLVRLCMKGWVTLRAQVLHLQAEFREQRCRNWLSSLCLELGFLHLRFCCYSAHFSIWPLSTQQLLLVSSMFQ